MNDVDFLLQLTELLPTKRPNPSISGWVQGRRILPASTPFPGPWDNTRTPYLVEPMDALGPFSGVAELYVMKGAQIGATAGLIENPIAYYMGENPAEQLLVSATDDALERWGTKRLEPLIDSCGLRELIGIQSQAGGAKSRRTGDKTFCKTYPGGALDMSSAQSASSLRSDSKRFLALDEIDGAPAQLRTGEGRFVDVAYARTNAWGARKKIVAVSTPTKAGYSEIHRLYLTGDQRKYFVPCPHCGHMQVLYFGDEDSSFGIKAVTVDGVLQVYYQCEKGCPPIYDHHKTGMLAKGEWRATATPNSPEIRSYHLSSLYSPVGMLSWKELYKQFLKVSSNPAGLASFQNLYLGEPAHETGARPDKSKIIHLRGAYQRGTVPPGVLFLTVGVDVQRGNARNEKNPPRLEMEILGHGLGYRTWSVDYRIFKGAIEDPSAGAWAAFSNWAETSGMVFARADGQQFRPSCIFVDAGDGPNSRTVYDFCARWPFTFPSKGFDALKKRKEEKRAGDTEGDFDEGGVVAFKKYRAVRISESTVLYTISTTHYKSLIYGNLKKERGALSNTPPGFCDFPANYPDEYFDGISAEEKLRDGTFYCPHGRRNEPLDCRVYAMCAADVFLEGRVMAYRKIAKERGATAMQIAQINSRYALERMAQAVGEAAS